MSKRCITTKKNTISRFKSRHLEYRNFEPIVSSQKVAGVVFTVGGLASGAKGLMDVVKGATPGQV